MSPGPARVHNFACALIRRCDQLLAKNSRDRARNRRYESCIAAALAALLFVSSGRMVIAMSEITASASSPMLPVYNRPALAFERGEGVWLIDTKGGRHLDFAAGIAVNALGHGHPHLVKALQDQAGKLWHVSNLYRIPEGEKLAQRLVDHSFADYVFFQNSGAEALEGAIKTARRYHFAKGAPQRNRIITFSGAFHGRTLTTVTAGGNAKYTEGLDPLPGGFDHVPFGDHKALEAAVTEETAAILIEPVQGEGGIRAVPHHCLRGLRELCDKHGILLIFDEVQCGMGRSGKLFQHEWAGVTPDIMAIAKGIGGGFPLGAFLTTREAGSGMTLGTHGSTYAGNPLGMAVGNAVLDVMLADGFLEEVQRMAGFFRQGFAALKDQFPDVIADVRIEGLLMGLKMVGSNLDFVAAARAENLLTVGAADNVVRVIPPLTITEAEARIGFDKIAAACQRLVAKAAA
jgi:acetylornithine/N-succinyldiaminopimelate aminotransferase